MLHICALLLVNGEIIRVVPDIDFARYPANSFAGYRIFQLGRLTGYRGKYLDLDY